MIIKPLSSCSFQTALDVWNKGFAGYVVDMTLSFDSFLTRITSDGIAPEHSFVAFIDEHPVGFLLNAFREERSRKLAWNGGTGVDPDYRGRGVGDGLLNAAMDLYQAQGVDLALLEAVSTNQAAISLYKKFGYEVIEELTFLQTDNPVTNFQESAGYSVDDVELRAIAKLDFYNELASWKGQWQSLVRARGEACIVRDRNQRPVGYGLFNKRFDSSGKLESIALFQCETAPEHADAEAIMAHVLNRVFIAVPGEYRRMTHNLRKSNRVAVELLMKAGFTTFVEQVQMMKRFVSREL
jgi:ribosomal protein S18 acetylase RimI-like enzyme